MSSLILHQTCWRQTPGKRVIELFSSLHGTQRPYLFIGGVHGDEPEGVQLAQEFHSWLQKNNSTAFHPWMLIPCLNVDGFASRERTNFRGVDLNRNFPTPDWSPEAKAPRYSPGPRPNSEMETQYLVQLIEKTKPSLIVHFHSWKPSVVYTGNPGKWAAELLAEKTGYNVSEDIGYPTPGSLGQYGWLNHEIPVICIEAQEKSELSTVWPKFSHGLKSIMTR